MSRIYKGPSPNIVKLRKISLAALGNSCVRGRGVGAGQLMDGGVTRPGSDGPGALCQFA